MALTPDETHNRAARLAHSKNLGSRLAGATQLPQQNAAGQGRAEQISQKVASAGLKTAANVVLPGSSTALSVAEWVVGPNIKKWIFRSCLGFGCLILLLVFVVVIAVYLTVIKP